MATVDEDGGLIIFNTKKSGVLAVAQDWLAHRNAVFDVEWMPGANKLLTASGDQTIALWDVEAEQIISVFRGHSSSVKTVRFLASNDAVFASGSRDGHVMFWDRRVQQKEGSYQSVNVIRNAHACLATTTATRGTVGSATKKKQTAVSCQDRQQSVTAVVFQDENTLISAGSVDGSVKVWDLRKNYSMLKSEALHKHAFPYAGKSIRTHGFSSLVLDSTSTRLFASCMDNLIYQFDCAAFTTSPVAKFRGHKNATFYVKTSLSPDDRFLLGGSSDFNAYVWRVDHVTNPESGRTPVIALEGHSNEVTGVAWSPTDICRLVTLSDDNTVWIWRLNQCRSQDLGVNNELGDVVGRTRRLCAGKDTTSGSQPMNFLSHSGGLRSEPRTPKRSTAAVLSPSPAKLSPAMIHSLKTLPSTLSGPASSSSKGAFSLSRWLGKPSPRKLVVTPKKSVGVASTLSSEGATQLKSIRPGVKRKLCDDSSSDAMSPVDGVLKVTILDSENDPKLSPIAVRLDSGLKSERILSAVQINFDRRSDECRPNAVVAADDFDVVMKESSSSRKESAAPPSVFRSPTVDLPNYVLDPQPRTPIGRWTSPRKPRTPDWLTQLRLSKQQTTSPTQINESPSGRSSGRGAIGRSTGSPSTRCTGNSSPVSETRKLPAHDKVSIRKFLNKSKADK